ncbi:nucleoporin NUP188 homolog isoform X1 [Strongylocentrotus purpuratus]|uniref:Nucleoporin NUP188 n=1 Tax=Strongylocentrotus purpuratus TaxID=7668 RepID=A0A7M7PQJ5_STRPU|nr:nucleoporin NUP188 homolog isoform X1 [Strongylocentrotus purpuratus]
MAVVTTSCQELLLIISGHSAIRDKELIKAELVNDKKKFLEGVLVFKKHNEESEKKLKEEKAISELERKFLLQACRFLDLDALQCRELFDLYLLCAFRGTGKQLQAILKNERSVQAMLLKLWEFYHADRLHLLQCIKHLANFWQDTEHPYQAQYADFVEELQSKGLFDKLLAQYKDRFSSPAPTKDKAGQLMTDRHRIRWCIQSLHEQSELLGIILLFLHASLTPMDKLLTIINLFQQQGFGTRQPYRHLLDAEEMAQKLTNKIEFLCCVIVLECMDLFPLMGLTDKSSIENHPLIANEKLSKEFSSAVQSLGQSPSHTPIQLAWMVIHTAAWPGKDTALVRRLGNQALRLHVFKYLTFGLSKALPNDSSVESMACHSVIYSLMTVVLTVFQEDSLGGVQDLVQLSCQLLSQPHLCREFWTTDLDGGFAALLQSSMASFPLEFSLPMKFLKALSTEGSKQIYQLLAHLPAFTEPLDNNRSSDIETSAGDDVWKLVNDKVVCKAGKNSPGFVIPAGTLGQLEQRPDGPPLITWDVDYSGLQLFQCVLDWLISAAPTTSPSDTLVQQAKDVIDLVEQMLQSDWSVSEYLQPITDCILPLISSLVQIQRPPLHLIGSCVKCLNTMAKYDPEQLWQALQSTGFLPYTGTLYTQVGQAASGDGVFPGSYGKVALEWEKQFGTYPVTLEFIKLVHTLIEGLASKNVSMATSQDLLACIIFLQRDIFTTFQRWRYTDFKDKEKIGLSVMEVFHVVLHVVPTSPVSKKPVLGDEQPEGVSVRDACIYGLLHTAAGQSLLTIAATGVDTIEQKQLECGSFLDVTPESQLVKLSLSILNRLLLLKPQQETGSRSGSPTHSAPEQCPLEVALTSHSTGLPHQPHLVAVIAGYIYHRQDPRLPTLAVLLLRRLAQVAPMSLFGCLGNQAPAFRDAFLFRLQTHSEDIRLRVGILELLAVSAETQPGFSELFLNLQPKKDDPKGKKKKEKGAEKKSPKNEQQELEIGKISCIHAVLDILEESKQGTTHSPPDLHCAALGFLQALWQDRRETALSILRKRSKFWSDVAAPLFKNPPAPEPESQVTSSLIKIRAHAFRILALECFHAGQSGIPKDLDDVLKKLDEENRFQFWSKYVGEVLEAYAPTNVDVEEYTLREHEGLVLLQAWRTVLVVAASQKFKALSINETATQSTILNDLVAAIHKQAQNLDSIFNAKALALLSSVYLTLVTRWKCNLSGQWSKVKLLVGTLEAILASEDTPLLRRCQAAMMGALTNVLRHRRLKQTKDKEGIELSLMERLLPPICVALQHSKTYHKPPKSVPQPPTQEVALDITMEDLDRTGAAEELVLRSQGDKVTKAASTAPIQLPVIAAYLLDEVLLSQADHADQWMPLIREQSVVSLLLSTLQACLQAKKGLHYVEAVMVLLKDLAAIPPTAEAVRITGYIQHTCLSLVWLHENVSEQDYTWSKKTKGEKPDGTSWLTIYVESISVTATLLATLSHAFLTDALDFFGVHRERMMKCLESVYLLQSPLQLEEAQATTSLVYQLAHHTRQWRFNMPAELALLQETLARLTQSCVALLIRPRLLQHMLEMKTNAKDASQSQPLSQVMQKVPRRLLQHQVSTDQSDASISDDAQEVQSRLLVIMSRTLASFRLFSPDLLESLLNQSLDVSEYPMLYCLGFSTPSLDQKTPASFGTLISCINWCLQMLPKLDVNKSPMKVLDQKPAASPSDAKTMQRPVLLFVLENAVHLIMAQGMRTFRDPAVPTRDRQLLKRELGSELNTFLISLQRYFRRGKPGSPSDASPGTSSARLATGSATSVMTKASLNAAFTEAKEQLFFKVVQIFVIQLSK